ncbi:MAG: hypothetical protein KGJ55_10855 [Gammaproteobacteria bacterium]|nr:hypothetical protein [Gammaproteobacteria bacterium]
MGLGVGELGQPRLRDHRPGGFLPHFSRQILGARASRYDFDRVSGCRQRRGQCAGDDGCAVAGCAGRPSRLEETSAGGVHRARRLRHCGTDAGRRKRLGLGAAAVLSVLDRVFCRLLVDRCTAAAGCRARLGRSRVGVRLCDRVPRRRLDFHVGRVAGAASARVRLGRQGGCHESGLPQRRTVVGGVYVAAAALRARRPAYPGTGRVARTVGDDPPAGRGCAGAQFPDRLLDLHRCAGHAAADGGGFRRQARLPRRCADPGAAAGPVRQFSGSAGVRCSGRADRHPARTLSGSDRVDRRQPVVVFHGKRRSVLSARGAGGVGAGRGAVAVAQLFRPPGAGGQGWRIFRFLQLPRQIRGGDRAVRGRYGGAAVRQPAAGDRTAGGLFHGRSVAAVASAAAGGTGARTVSRSALTYARYLQLDGLLALQRVLSEPPEHDELLFIVVHQVYELWFKQLLHELARLRRNLEDGATMPALATFKRVLTIFKTLVAQIDVLETMTPASFNAFRARLQSASGFQSLQFRLLECALGIRRRQVLAAYAQGSAEWRRLRAAMTEPSLYDSFLAYLQRHGHAVLPALLVRDPGQSPAASDELQATLLAIYRQNDPAVQVCERLVDLDEALQEWRYRHVKMVERTIGNKPGTGGSSGVEYLRDTLFKPLFADLWAIRAGL